MTNIPADEFTYPSSFCVIPWIHYFRPPDGNISLCCISDQLSIDAKNMTFEEVFNSEQFKKIRTQMLTGVLPKECHLCKNSNSNRKLKDQINFEFKDIIPKIFETTLLDGSSSLSPLYLDFRFPTCNLTCNTCNTTYSSAWRKEIYPNEHVNKDEQDFLMDEYKRVIQKYDWEKIYFAGGEPLMQKNHLEILNYLKNNKLPKNITILYNTNLVVGKEFLRKWLSILADFKKVRIFVSVDSYGPFNDLIRNGSRFKDIQDNLDILSENKNIELVIDLTMTSIFFYNVIEFSQWITTKKYNLIVRKMHGTGYLGSFLRLEVLKIEFRRNIFKKWLQWYFAQTKEDQFLLQNLFEVLSIFHSAKEESPVENPLLVEDFQKIMHLNLTSLHKFISETMSSDLCFKTS